MPCGGLADIYFLTGTGNASITVIGLNGHWRHCWWICGYMYVLKAVLIDRVHVKPRPLDSLSVWLSLLSQVTPM